MRVNDSRPVRKDEDVKSGRPCGDLEKEMLPSEANTFVTLSCYRA
jgi:hypothetical protein